MTVIKLCIHSNVLEKRVRVCDFVPVCACVCDHALCETQDRFSK